MYTSIRAVLQQLAQSGLIESRDGVGHLVTDLDFAQVRDIYQMRQKLTELIGHLFTIRRRGFGIRMHSAMLLESLSRQTLWLLVISSQTILLMVWHAWNVTVNNQ